MTSGPPTPTFTSDALSTERPTRLCPKLATSGAEASGFAEGAWWPRSRALSVELPAPFAALTTRLGEVRRLSLNLTERNSSGRGIHISVEEQRAVRERTRRSYADTSHEPRIPLGTGQVRLRGFRSQTADTVTGSGEHRVTLPVLPPATSAVDAEVISRTAAGRGDTDSVDHLLTPAEAAQPIRRVTFA
jgi:hypothetical protein